MVLVCLRKNMGLDKICLVLDYVVFDHIFPKQINF